MNTRLINAIHDCGLTFVRKHQISHELELYESTHRVGDIAFGQYLLVPLTYDQFLHILEESSAYAAFEEQVLSTFYFRLRGDWGWNLYLCFILEDSDIQRIPLAKMAQIERGKKYGKKLIIGWSELQERLPAAKIPDRISGQVATDPLGEWEGILAPLGLEFCLDDYREARIEAYLGQEEISLISQSVRHVSTEQIRRPIGPIQTLRFGSLYRPHLLSGAAELEFVKVNLLYGANGMGKTSILEGIELSFTGNVQRNLLSEAREAENWDGSLIFSGDENVFNGMPSEQERKEREIAYYKHKVAPRAKSQMNRVFHQYNYFSSEAVHQFCYNIDARTDYRNDFARVIYGEQLERMEQRWTQYKTEFGKNFTRLQKRIEELTTSVELIQRDDYQATGIMQQRAITGAMNMKKWINMCKFTYPTLDDRVSIHQVDEWLQHISPLINELEIRSRSLADNTNTDLDNETELYDNLNRSQNSEKELNLRKAETITQINKLPDISDLEAKVKEYQANNIRNSPRIEQLKELALRIRNYKNIYDQIQTRNLRKELQNRKTYISHVGTSLNKLQVDYRHLADQQVSITDLPKEELQLVQLEFNYRESVDLFNHIANQVEDYKENTSKIQRLVSELKALGKQYLAGKTDERQCPLCGHAHEEHQILLEAVENGVLADDQMMSKLLDDKEIKRTIMVKNQQAMNNLSAQIRDYKEQYAAYKVVANLPTDMGIHVNKPFSPKVLQKSLIEINNRLVSSREEFSRLDGEIKRLESEGFTLQAIVDLEEVLENPELEFIRSEISNNIPSELILSLIEREYKRILSENSKIVINIDELQKQIQQIGLRKEDHNKQLVQINKWIDANARMLQDLNQKKEVLVSLKESNILIKQKDSWKEWRSYLIQLQKESETLRKILEPAVLIEHNALTLDGLRKEMNTLTERITRCRQVINALSSLRSLADYGDDFVRSNFEAISRLFIALHAPNEFVTLQLSDENQIIARRRGQESSCAIYQMSTGQRTSVILAIFFMMHLVMDTAPKFLMLDEPVANMDELNVLGLLDFLRQLAVTRGTQIFFTTANPQVATLFRRKFSFFKEKFRAYQFQRNLEGPVNIRVQQFVPQLESPVVSFQL